MLNLYPEDFARFYDIIYNSIRDGVDNFYYLEKIAAQQGMILEVGAGTGRLFVPALKNGADIYAIDISSPMMDILKSKINAKFHYRISHNDVRDFNLNKKFDLIIAPFRVFSHLLYLEDQLKALNNLYLHLNNGGILIFDLYIPDLEILRNGFQNHVDFEGEYSPGNMLRRIVNSENNLIEQITRVNFTIQWQESGNLKSMDWGCDLRYFFRFEIENLIRLSDFNSYTIYGDFHEGKLDTNSKEFIVHCKKIEILR